MIVITDGESHDSPDLEKVIQQSERDNVTRYAVAVSPVPHAAPHPYLLEALPSTPWGLCMGECFLASELHIRALGWACPSYVFTTAMGFFFPSLPGRL